MMNMYFENFPATFTQKALTLAVQIALLSGLTQTAFAASPMRETTQQLETILVEVDDASSSEQAGGYSYKQAKTATKLNLTLRDTPQNVKVYTEEYLEDRNIQSFQSLMKNITGVTVSRTDERQTNYARGFSVDYYLIDGIPTTTNIAEGDLDISIFDRVEVVKGANGLMTGAGNPAMGLNLIRKHADSKELTGKIEASAGSWNSYASSADISSGLNADGSLRGRIYVKHSDEDSFMNGYEKTRNVAYAALDYDLTDKTSLSLAAAYQELDRSGIRWGGLPAFYADGTQTHFDRDLTVSSDWTYWNINTTALFASLKQQLWNDAALNVAYSYRKDDKETALLYYGGKVVKETGLSAIQADTYSSDTATEENNIDVYVNIPFQIGGMAQEVVMGGSSNKNELLYSYSGKPKIDNYILDFNRLQTHLVGGISNPTVGSTNTTEQSGFYASGKFQLMDDVKLVAGARFSNWKYIVEGGKTNREFNDQFTPYVGLIYDFLPDHSWYASYTEIFKPQDKKTADGNYLDPIIGKNYETGVKSEFLDGRLNTTAAIFRIEQDNAAEKIDGSFVQGTTEQAYRAVNGVVSKGVEFEADGQITDQWSVNLGIANFEARDQANKKVNLDNARTSANLFTKYALNSWSLGAGLNYRSKIKNIDGVNPIQQDAVILVNAMAAYQVDANIKLQLNLDNLLDEEYYDGIGANRMNYAEPRKATFSLKYQF